MTADQEIRLGEFAHEKANEVEDIDMETLMSLVAEGAHWMEEELKNEV